MDLVCVKWRDIISCAGWEKAKEIQTPILFSVGWLVSKDNDTIKIATCLDYDDFTGEAQNEEKPVPYGITAFPVGCVVKISVIVEQKDEHRKLPENNI